jgi:di/tricarboxylate transporter
MNASVASLVTLFLVVGAGCFSRLNVGVLSFLLAFALGHFFCGLSASEVAAGFPARLFLHLTGITLLFSLAGANGTLNQLAWRAVRLVRADPRLVTLIVFVLAVALASSGAGNFATTAMLAPVVMGVAARLRVSPFLMAVMLVNGASAGAFSPIAPTGIVAKELMVRIGLGGNEWAVYLNSLAAHTLVALIGYVMLGGPRLSRMNRIAGDRDTEAVSGARNALNRSQLSTIIVIMAFGVATVGFRLDIGVAAFAGAALLILAGAADEPAAMNSVPWGVILMVCGVTTLVSVIETAGGTDLFARLLAGIAGPAYLPGLAALMAGIISVPASSIGVVLPALLPVVPSLLVGFGGGNPLMIAFSINVSAHLVDISPLSPLGAMCLAYAPAEEDRAALFRKLMVAGWTMALVGSLLCQLMFGFR